MKEDKAIKKVDNNIIDVWKKRDIIRKIFAPTLTEDEFMFFLGLGKSMGANPFKREIWAIKYKKESPASIFLARDFYRKVAQSQPDYEVHRSFSVYENDDFCVKNGELSHTFKLKNRGKLIGAYAQLFKKNSDKPYVVFVNLDEYFKGGKQFKNTWDDIPATMINKVAEAQVLRMAYSDVFSGTYSEVEQETIEKQIKEENMYKDEPPIIESEADIIEDTPEHNIGNEEEYITDAERDWKPANLFENDIKNNKKEGKNYHELIQNYLEYMYLTEKERCEALGELTEFIDKTGKIIKVYDVKKLSLPYAKVTWHKIEKIVNQNADN